MIDFWGAMSDERQWGKRDCGYTRWTDSAHAGLPFLNWQIYLNKQKCDLYNGSDFEGQLDAYSVPYVVDRLKAAVICRMSLECQDRQHARWLLFLN